MPVPAPGSDGGSRPRPTGEDSSPENPAFTAWMPAQDTAQGPEIAGTTRRSRAGRRRMAPRPITDETPGDEPHLDSAERADLVERAKEYCLTVLASAPRTRADLAGRLAARDYPMTIITEVLDRLEEVRLLDDASYAQMFAASRHEARGLAGRAIRSELRRKGVSDEAIDAALAEVDEVAEEARALALVRRKAGATRGLDEATRTRRLVGMLGRKGYPPGLAYRVVRTVLAEDSDEDLLTDDDLDPLD